MQLVSVELRLQVSSESRKVGATELDIKALYDLEHIGPGIIIMCYPLSKVCLFMLLLH